MMVTAWRHYLSWTPVTAPQPHNPSRSSHLNPSSLCQISALPTTREWHSPSAQVNLTVCCSSVSPPVSSSRWNSLTVSYILSWTSSQGVHVLYMVTTPHTPSQTHYLMTLYSRPEVSRVSCLWMASHRRSPFLLPPPSGTSPAWYTWGGW